MIIVGTRFGGTANPPRIDSVSEALIHRAPCPVLVVYDRTNQNA